MRLPGLIMGDESKGSNIRETHILVSIAHNSTQFSTNTFAQVGFARTHHDKKQLKKLKPFVSALYDRLFV